MLKTILLSTLLTIGYSITATAKSPSISDVDSNTPSEKLPVPGDVFFGQKITFDDMHSGDVIARVGLWEAGVSKSRLEDYPFTEYVLMISGRLILTNEDGSSKEYVAGDTFVIPKGWTGIWDIKEHMKKQMVQVGDPSAKPSGTRLTD